MIFIPWLKGQSQRIFTLSNPLLVDIREMGNFFLKSIRSRFHLAPVIALGCIFTNCAPSPREFACAGRTMGTRWSLRTIGRAADPGNVQQQLAVFEAIFSTWDPQSEVSRFNRHPAGEPFPASIPLRDALALAQEVHARSQGAFDPTVGPLVAAFGFGPSSLANPNAQPDFAAITLDLQGGTLRKSHPDVTLDLSALVEGYALDKIAAALFSQGHDNFLLEIGGEFLARGSGPEGQGWKTGVQTPSAAPGRTIAAVTLHNEAIATSGTYVQQSGDDAHRVTHIIDPRTRRPIAHETVSVTVISGRAVWADAWATALLVLGPAKGREIADREGIEALFLTRNTAHGEARAPSGAPRATAAPAPASSARGDKDTRSK